MGEDVEGTNDDVAEERETGTTFQWTAPGVNFSSSLMFGRAFVCGVGGERKLFWFVFNGIFLPSHSEPSLWLLFLFIGASGGGWWSKDTRALNSLLVLNLRFKSSVTELVIGCVKLLLAA